MIFIKKNNSFLVEDLSKSLYKIEEDDSILSEKIDLNSLKVKQVLDTILGLKDNYRMVLTLFFIEGYDQEEICEILKISYANCRTSLSRAKESLRKKLEEI